jgi:hypothetical protein
MNTDPARTTDPISMEMRSQEFGAFLPDLGLIGQAAVPPIQPQGFFDVFFDVDLASLPPQPPEELPGGGPPAGNNPCGPIPTGPGTSTSSGRERDPEPASPAR